MTIFNIHYPTSLLPYLVLDPVVLLALLYHQFCRAQVIAIDTRCWTEKLWTETDLDRPRGRGLHERARRQIRGGAAFCNLIG